MTSLKIIKISKKKVAVIPLCIIMCFLPIFLHDKIFVDTFWGIWTLFWLAILIIYTVLVDRYKESGRIYFNHDYIEIDDGEKKEKLLLEESLIIDIYYNGYKGEELDYNFLFLRSLRNKDGIGTIYLTYGSSKKKITYVAILKDTLKNLYQLQQEYQKNEIKFYIAVS
jgi:hypothetical protein